MSEMRLSDSEWKKKLTPEQYKTLRQKGTEVPFTGLLETKETGMYMCAGSGWPSFFDAVEKGNVKLQQDRSHGMRRIEVVCKKCGGHLGHLFDDGPHGKRYCINSCALEFRKKE